MCISRVITSLQDWECMEEINSLTGLSNFNTDNWINLETFLENPKLKKFISENEFELLANNEADYIAFRIED